MQTYICKCGRTFQKSSKSETTGFSLSDFRKGHECYGCPYIVEYADWQTREITKHECRATPKIEYKTYCRIATGDKDFHAAFFYTLDICFAKKVYERCQQLQGCDNNAKYFTNAVPEKWRAADFDNDCGLIKFPLYFTNNRQGTEARRTIYNEFFATAPQAGDETTIKSNIRRAIATANETEDINMARKFNFDLGISKDLKAAASDSFIDSLKMINVENLIPSNDNFYEISGIEELADDIERQGLKHNLVVAARSDGNYDIISGHRRCAAKKLLIEQSRTNTHTLPCYIYAAEGKTEAEIKLDLIMLNATQRKYTDIDLASEYDELSKVYAQLKAEGKEIKGNTRDNIAAALKVSSAQIGKLENIQRNAAPEVQKAVSRGDMSISTANEVAKLDEAVQKEIVKKNEKEKVTNKEVKSIQAAKIEKPAKPEAPEPLLNVEQNEKVDIYISSHNSGNEKADEIETLIQLLEQDPIYDFLGGTDGDEIIFDGDRATDIVIAALQAYKVKINTGSSM